MRKKLIDISEPHKGFFVKRWRIPYEENHLEIGFRRWSIHINMQKWFWFAYNPPQRITQEEYDKIKEDLGHCARPD